MSDPKWHLKSLTPDREKELRAKLWPHSLAGNSRRRDQILLSYGLCSVPPDIVGVQNIINKAREKYGFSTSDLQKMRTEIEPLKKADLEAYFADNWGLRVEILDTHDLDQIIKHAIISGLNDIYTPSLCRPCA
jgi:hypothetical protein